MADATQVLSQRQLPQQSACEGHDMFGMLRCRLRGNLCELHGSTALEVAHEDMVVIYRASQMLHWLCLSGISQLSLSRARILHLLQLAIVSCFRKLPEAMTRRF